MAAHSNSTPLVDSMAVDRDMDMVSSPGGPEPFTRSKRKRNKSETFQVNLEDGSANILRTSESDRKRQRHDEPDVRVGHQNSPFAFTDAPAIDAQHEAPPV